MVSSKKSETTRRRILEATWTLLKRGPESRTRMADVAKEAGVSRQAVYLYFPSRADLLVETTRHIDEIEDVAGQIGAVLKHQSGRDRLRAFVYAWGNYIPVVYGGARRLLAIREVDPDADAAWQDRMSGLYNVCDQIVGTLEVQGDLIEGIGRVEAIDLLWAAVSVQRWELLTVDRKMPQDRYLELTHRMLLATLVAP